MMIILVLLAVFSVLLALGACRAASADEFEKDKETPCTDAGSTNNPQEVGQ